MTICEELKRAREERGLTLDEAAAEARIPRRYLSALEGAEFESLGGRVYALNYGKQYAATLGVLRDDWYQDLVRSWEIYQLRQTLLGRRVTWRDQVMRFRTRSSTMFLGALGALLILLYLGYQLSYLIGSPSIIVREPASFESISHESSLLFSGSLTREARLSVDGRPVELDPNRDFSFRLYLAPGLNTIDLTASNLAGKTVHARRYITYVRN